MSNTEPLPDPRKARKEKGVRREELAVTAGVSLSLVAACEQKGMWPKQLLVRARYLAALGLSESAS